LKRLADVSTAFLFLLFFPLHFWLLYNPRAAFANALQILSGNKTWIGYATPATGLPPLRPAVLTPEGDALHGVLKKADTHHDLVDFWYAENYEPRQDLHLLFKNYRRLGG
ncbi:MAG TPA: hypothetical protein VM010_06510, partial [Chitinophagaceae bacterium]|nr:hypothetical protein [Chitinophagaceae bacterium]